MTTVVCFGDSNTYGTPAMPDLLFWGRHEPDRRWPGVLRTRLGAGWSVIEEGLPGRTTVHDDPIEGAHMNGLKALPMVLGTHRPIDWLIVALGSNDLKARFSVTPDDIAASAGVLVQTALASPAGPDGKPPKILFVAPPPIVETGCLSGHFYGGAEKSRRFGAAYRQVAERLGVAFLDSGDVVTSDPLDGIHLSADQHARLGQAIADKIRGD